jgi:hypothetical protein
MMSGRMMDRPDSEKLAYESLYRNDLRRQLEELVARWQTQVRASPLRWIVDDLDVAIEIRNLSLRRSGPLYSPSPGLALVRTSSPQQTGPEPQGAREDPTGRRRHIVAFLRERAPDGATIPEIENSLRDAGFVPDREGLHKLLGRMAASGSLNRVGRGRYRAGPVSAVG